MPENLEFFKIFLFFLIWAKKSSCSNILKFHFFIYFFLKNRTVRKEQGGGVLKQKGIKKRKPKPLFCLLFSTCGAFKQQTKPLPIIYIIFDILGYFWFTAKRMMWRFQCSLLCVCVTNRSQSLQRNTYLCLRTSLTQ